MLRITTREEAWIIQDYFKNSTSLSRRRRWWRIKKFRQYLRLLSAHLDKITARQLTIRGINTPSLDVSSLEEVEPLVLGERLVFRNGFRVPVNKIRLLHGLYRTEAFTSLLSILETSRPLRAGVANTSVRRLLRHAILETIRE